MSIKRVVPNITTDRIEDSCTFYTSLFGFRVAMDMGWIVTLASPDQPSVQISLVRGERADDPGTSVTMTIEVGDVDEIHALTVSADYHIAYPLTNEPWGVRRFHVEDPNGVIINVMCHVK